MMPHQTRSDETPWRSRFSRHTLAMLATGTVVAVALATIFDGLRLAIGQEANADLERGGYFLFGLGAILLTLCLFPLVVREPLVPMATETAPEVGDTAPEVGETPPDENRRQIRLVVICLALIVTFIVLLPWVGFAIANGILLVGYLRAVSHYRWIIAIVSGCAMDAVFVALFVATRVPMPAGVLFG